MRRNEIETNKIRQRNIRKHDRSRKNGYIENTRLDHFQLMKNRMRLKRIVSPKFNSEDMFKAINTCTAF